MSQHNELLHNLFAESLDIEDEDERSAFLARACGENAGLRGEVEDLIQAGADAGRFLPSKPLDGVAMSLLSGLRALGEGAPPASEPSLALEKTGDRIGRYKLLRKLGEGGCGVVYLAEQEEPVKRRVALKVIKLGMDTREVIARFEAERQALALMDHPNIAKVLDGGATSAGRPFFVMELVHGIPINGYCDEHRMDIRQRLEIFRQVCQAIQHAHQKGVIHRDLKPSNILVMDLEGVSVPKVIDFGIAKATAGQTLTDKTIFTAFEQFIGTPAYMSPEQAQLSGLDIDTRSDVYSLGVLLYELLTGRTPFDAKRLIQAGFDEARRIIRDEDPIRPSTRLSALNTAEQTGVARWRGCEPPRLVWLIRGDLDCIVMKALEKDRDRRYETANGLAMDLERFLIEEPILARPPSRWYRLRKLARRNRLVVAAMAAVTASLVVGIGLATWMFLKERAAWRAEVAQRQLTERQAERADREAARARAAAVDATEKLWLSYLHEAKARRSSGRIGRRIEALEALKKAAAIRPSIELRNEAIASLALPDLRVRPVSGPPEDGAIILGFDDTFERHVLLQTNGTASVVRTADHSEMMTLPGLRRPPSAFVGAGFSPDGHFLAAISGTEDPRLSVWDLKRHALIHVSNGRCRCFAFSPDSRRLASGLIESGTRQFPIEIYDLIEQRMVTSFDHGIRPFSVRFHPRFNLLATSGDDSTEVWIWNLETQMIERRLPHPGPVSHIAWNPEGDLLASGCADNQVYVWDVGRGTPAHVLAGHSGFPREISFSSDGQFLASRGWDGVLRFWDPWTGQCLLRQPVSGWTSGFSSAGFRYGFHPGEGQTAYYELEPSRECRCFRPSRFKALGQNCDFSPDGSLLLTAHEDGVRLWSLADGRVQKFLPKADTRQAIFGPLHDRVFVASDTGMVEWTLSGTSQIAGVADEKPITGLAVDEILLGRSGTTLGFSAGSSMNMLDLSNRALTSISWGPPFPGQGRTWLSSSLSPDEKLLACGAADSSNVLLPVRIFRTTDRQLIHELQTAGRNGARTLFSPNGFWLLTGDNREYCLWDVGAWRKMYSIPRGDVGYAAFMSFSPDSALLAMALSRDTVQLVEALSGREIATLMAPEASDIYHMTFSRDGSKLAVMCRNGPVHLWDLRLIRTRLAEMNLDGELSSTGAYASANR